VAEDWQCLRRLAARVAATDGSAPDHRERCGPCRLLARIATPNRLDCLPPFWAAFCATWGEPTLLLLAALLFGLGLIVWDYGFGGLWYFLTNLDEPAVADTGRPAGARAARRRRRAGAWGSRGPQRVRRGWGGSRRRPAPLSGRPAYLRDLGTLLIALRGDKGLREAAARIGVPKSTLWRWENTGRVPSRKAQLLDDAYGCGREFVEAVVRLRQRVWNPYYGENAEPHHAHRWPAEYSGQVWIWVRPASAHVGRVHDIRIRWGPWRQNVTRALGREGLTLLTGKGKDDVAITCEVMLDQTGLVLFGTGGVTDGLTLVIQVFAGSDRRGGC